MCFGGSKKAHQAAEEQKRIAGQRATAQRIAMENAMREAEERNRRMVEALKPEPPTYTPEPYDVRGTVAERGVRRKRSSKRSAGVGQRSSAQLRIPLGTGGSRRSGLNL